MFATRYFPTRYFTARYFAESGAAPEEVEGVYFAPRYFASGYFAPRYFPGFGVGEAGVSVVPKKTYDLRGPQIKLYEQNGPELTHILQ